MLPPSEAEAQGLSFVLLEPGPNVSEAEHHDWYDNEHVPARLTIPTFLNAARFKAVDGQKPTYLTLYDISESSVADGPEYQAVKDNGSERDKRLLATVQYLNRRAYSSIFNSTLTTASGSDFPPKFIFVVGLEVKTEGEADFNKLYNEEHIPMISKIPGWLRSRRYILSNSAIRGSIDAEVTVCKYLVIHDFSDGGYMDTSEMKAAASTPWVNEVLKSIVRREARHFTLLKEYKRPE
ncbi:hypothetical protein EV368DRAFT_82663 [Lentinula lateritia]|uniref:Uncharacterized protein n=1 Tax=Lentinula aff. lateritia TaxID=2804960 RepID=A0ACC1U9E0_9AGAR|nr:hypothetical protein F5876DRAFT_63000 [Lentinula aff. lateritia]KAJ3852323.1 hypothetical protein EV368DRAFT_82663 [Lentinula lateritia]